MGPGLPAVERVLRTIARGPLSRDRRPGRPWRRFARADETWERRLDVGLLVSLRQMVTP